MSTSSSAVSTTNHFSPSKPRRAAQPLAACEIDLLGCRARVAGPAPIIRRLRGLHVTSDTWSAQPAPREAVAFHVRANAPRPGWHLITCDGDALWEIEQPAEVLPHLQYSIMVTAMERLKSDHLLLHGGAVAIGDCGILLPAPSRGGKSTLTAGLLAAGLQYCSDDVIVLELSQGRLVPFPKAIAIRSGSRRVLRQLYPSFMRQPTTRLRLGQERVSFVRPERHILPAEPVPVRFVVLPRYRPGAATVLEPISRSAALKCFMEQSFNLHVHGGAGLGTLIGVLGRAECYALTMGDLAEAVRLVGQLAQH